jgi:hypothetical protein
MKQCPKCSKTYANDKQKFCTKDGAALVDALDASSGQGETVRIDSAQLDDEITKVISQALPPMSGSAFDPYKTQVSTQQEKAAPPPPEPSQPIAPPPAPAPPPAAAPPPSVAAPESPTPAPPPPSKPVTPPPATVLSPEPTPPVAAPEPPVPPPAPPSQPVVPPPVAAAPTPPPMSDTVNIGSAQATNASLMAKTMRPTIALPHSPAVSVAAIPQSPAPAKKRSKLPLILGILFVLLLLGAGGVVAGYFFVLKPMLDKKKEVVVVDHSRPEPTPMTVSTPDAGSTKPETPKVEVPPYSAPANAVQFVNSNAGLDGKLAEHYVDFSFYYPKYWLKDPKAGVSGASNFAKVERRLPPDFTQENFAVGWYASTGSEEGDRVVFPTLADNLSKQFAKSFAEYKKVSEGPTKAGVYDGYEFRFESVSRKTEHGDISIWGRVIFVPPTDGSNNGVTMLMLTTSLAPELRSVDDVGVRGDLPMMLESFRFGK